MATRYSLEESPLGSQAGAIGLEGPHRLLFVITSSDFGGSEEFLRQLVPHLDRRRFEATICSLRPLGRAGRALADDGFEVVSLDMSERPKIADSIRATRRLAQLIDRVDVDLVQGLLYRANAMAALAARLSVSKPIVVAGQRSLGPMRGSLPHWIARWSHRASARVVAVSEAVRQELIRSSAISPERIEVIGNGVDSARFRPAASGEIRRELGIDDDEVVLGTAGRLSAKKGLTYLLEATKLARERGANIHLLIVGDGPEKAALETRAASLDLGDAIHFLGFRSDLDRIYPELDIFALPSLEEGSPNALLEAMACGCAPIASAVGGIPEIIEDGISGLLIDSASPDQLADALTRLAADSGSRASMSLAARRRIEQDFDFSAAVSRYEDLYLSLLRHREEIGSTPK